MAVAARTSRLALTQPWRAVVSVLLVLAAAGLAAQQAPPPARQALPAPPSPQAQQPAPEVQRPVFRTGANAVRVDVYATQKGVPVEDLTAADFEVYEDNAPQKIDAFDHVKVQLPGPAAVRSEPRTMAESREMAADPRARVFILFLDAYHVHQTASYNVTRPLMNLLNRLIGDDDLIAVMTSDMSARQIMFTRRTDRIADMLDKVRRWGQRQQEVFSDDPVEQLYQECYPPQPGQGGGAVSPVALGMIERRREKMTLDALEDLVRYLGVIREERKAILLVSEGWQLFRSDPSMMATTGANPRVGIGADGRTVGMENRYVNRQCEADRTSLSGIDDERRFRDIMNLANRSNASFYPIEPRGLTAFDTELGFNPSPSVADDFTMLSMRHDSLRTIAENTDGVAVINSNNIEAGLKRVVSDLSSYYLLGYTSTNAKMDGKYRAIRVRVKRPGIEIRARRGYQAPTADEFARMSPPAAPPVDEAVAAVTKAVASLEGATRDAPVRLTVSPGWWTPAGGASTGKPAAAEPALWILGEVDTRVRTGDDWTQGAEVDVAISGGKDAEPIVRYTVPVAAGSTRFLTRFPRTVEDVWLDPGSYVVRVRIKPTAGGLPITDTARFDVASPGSATAMLLGQPLYLRRGSAAASPEQATSDRRFRRTERLVVQMSATLVPDRVSAELLDRSGKTLQVPVTDAVVEKDSVRWVRAELALAPLATGDYVIRLSTSRGDRTIQTLAPFRIVP